MAYRYGDRYQMSLIPRSIEECVPGDHPVRAYDAFTESLDFAELGIEINPDRVGNPEYDPRAVFKLLVFGYIKRNLKTDSLSPPGTRRSTGGDLDPGTLF